MKKGDFTINGKKMHIEKPFSVDYLDEIEAALADMENNNTWRGEIEVTWTQLQLFRRLLIMDSLSTNMMQYNLRSTLDRKKAERGVDR